MALSERMRQAVRFFAEHGGTVTPPGRMGSALSFARAEAWARDNDVGFGWEEEVDPDWSWREGGDPGYPQYVAVAYDATGKALASLGGIDLGGTWSRSHPYVRVVNAELAAEAMPGQAHMNPMRRPTRRGFRREEWGVSLKEAQAVWDRAMSTRGAVDPRAHYLREVAREPVGPTTAADYRRAIREPLPEARGLRRRYERLEGRYSDRPLEIWEDRPLDD